MKRKSILALLLITIMIFGTMVFTTACSSGKDKASEKSETEEPSDPESEKDEDQSNESQVATKEEMTEVEDVVEDWMVPIEGTNLNDGKYEIEVASSSSMFKISRCELDVADGNMTAVMTMGGTGYKYLFPGTGEEAVAAAESEYVAYEENSDGEHSFTIPVEALDKGIDVAAFSKRKEKWYDRTIVFRSDSLPIAAFKDDFNTTASSLGLADGEYTADIELVGGSGKASIESPAKIKVEGDICTVTLVWSSPNYDYMVVDGERYYPINTEGNSVFEVPVAIFDRFVPVAADTTAMSTPHEIDYRIKMDSTSIK